MSTALTTAAVLITAVLLATVWNRTRVIGRSALVVLSVLSVTAAVAVQVNRLTEAYPTQTVAAATVADDSGSRMLTVTVPGPASRLTLPMYVYLPAAYRGGAGRFPVIEALHGYPGTPVTWLRRLNVQSTLDREIAAGRMAPTVVLFPYQTPERLLDTECTNLRGGPQAETFLTVDVPAYVRAHYRVRTDQAAWGLTGYSAGAFCATDLALRHPGQYAAAASLSGYAEPGIDVGDGSQNTTNNPAWRLRHLPQPPIALWLGWAGDDRESAQDSRRLAAEIHHPLALTTAVLAHGGHSSAVWREMEPPAFDWLSAHLARPRA
ncbi:alpha/beta hydrolase-fold protein [Actinoplanes sp. TRM 88003]|uniref:Alpha/beta hydrolase-fold protein n=1 Tax=Paractinoplanes aksuensis TaxID=2939490 RepID=A0ABT1DYM2_9ACTN|nr:alpha/beta hydrolase-fold protein [Actinoplanes aksuensis]MCO8275990.1 alpha/beta hydrolase-fold protein [Actinoplanes aksuensis]